MGRRRCDRRQHDEDEDGWDQATDDRGTSIAYRLARARRQARQHLALMPAGRVPCGCGAHHRRRRAARRPARRSVRVDGQPARPAPGQSLARRREPDRTGHRGAGRASSRADPARRRHRRRRHPGRSPGARRAAIAPVVDRGHRQPARGPGRGCDRPRPRWRRRPASSCTSATAWRCPTPIARSTSSTPRWCSIT